MSNVSNSLSAAQAGRDMGKAIRNMVKLMYNRDDGFVFLCELIPILEVAKMKKEERRYLDAD